MNYAHEIMELKNRNDMIKSAILAVLVGLDGKVLSVKQICDIIDLLWNDEE